MNKIGFLRSPTRTTVLIPCLLILVTLLFLGCTKTKLAVISTYDAKAYEQIQQLKNKVDTFFVGLLEKKQTEREFSNFEQTYQQLATVLEKFNTDNQVRSKNSESARISQSIVNLWNKYQADHKAKKTYNDGTAKLNRSRFIRLFDSASRAERAKKRS